MELAHGRYRLTRRLGEGGTGVVYAASDTLLGRTVAIKALHPSFEGTLLHREGQSLARLNHPGVVSLYDLIEQDGRPYLVMEYVDGCDLGQWLAQHEPLDLESGLVLFARIAAVVADAHSSGILHCDLKPSNVLLSTSGEVKLSDFTLARLMQDQDSALPLGGSDGYTAPEVATGDTVDAATDIFSLGAILRRLTRTCLSDTDARAAGVRVAVDRALSPARSERFPTVEELLAALPLPPSDVTRLVGRSSILDLTRILPRSMPRAQPRKGRILAPAVTVFAALMLAGAMLVLRLPAAASPARVTLPNLVATQTGSAQLVARSLQLEYRVSYAYSSTVPAGVVMEQRPAPNSEIDKHGTVTVTVSKGPAPMPVPNLNGVAADTATAELSHLGFRVIQQTQDSVGTPAGIVLGQVPSPGTMKLPGSTVTLTVSQKPWWDVFGW
jgi:eukaryotic-like serine/threonine-protein kinase